MTVASLRRGAESGTRLRSKPPFRRVNGPPDFPKSLGNLIAVTVRQASSNLVCLGATNVKLPPERRACFSRRGSTPDLGRLLFRQFGPVVLGPKLPIAGASRMRRGDVRSGRSSNVTPILAFPQIFD